MSGVEEIVARPNARAAKVKATAEGSGGGPTEPKQTGQFSTEVEDVRAEGFTHRPVLVATIVCALVAALGHGLIWQAAVTSRSGGISRIYWQPVLGISMCIVGITAFGGFYLASRRARVAIAVSFLMVFFVLFSYVLTISGLQDLLNKGRDPDPNAPNIAKELINDFRWIVLTIIAFYFGSETLVSVSKIRNIARIQGATPDQVSRADRDLPATTKKP